MKTTRSQRAIVLATLACCAIAAPQFILAQPQAPAQEKTTANPDKPKTKPAPKPRAKNLTPRMVKATEAAMGKPLTPDLKEQLTKALREREAAIQAANQIYYAAFAQASGLTPEQAKEIDKPTRKTTKPVTAPKVEGETNMDALTEADDDDPVAPVTPE